ncbi:MAG: methyltransferase domain-containing protein, partial [Chloroflexota bacterium]|nr:methyltransferase domain-containing protein [Chloroflexota bacterium]
MGQKEPEWEKSVKWLAQENFGRQAREYNANALLADSGNLKAFVSLAGVTPTDRVLDVATGTGFLATALSVTTKQVVATDLTMPMLEQARVQVGDRGSAAFALADAENLPFASESFDVVACRVALHHFPHPLVAFDEMARVCRFGGRVVIMDIVSSEDRPKSDYHNRM